MPDTVEKRIVIAVDAGEALASLGKVKGSTDQLIRAKREELKISRAKANFDKAEAASATAAQRAYNAELARERKLKELAAAKKRGAEAGEIRRLTGEVKQLTDQYKKLAQAEDMANSRAKLAKQQMDAANASAVNFANKQQAKGGFFTRLIGRQLGVPVGKDADPDLMKLAAAGAVLGALKAAWEGVVDAIKAAREAEKKYAAERFAEQLESLTSVTARLSERSEAIDHLSKWNEGGALTSEQRVAQEKQIAELTAQYGDLGIVIDKTTGKIANLAEVQERMRKARNRQADRGYRAEMATIDERIKEQQEIYRRGNTYGWRVLHKYSFGLFGVSDEDAKEAVDKIAEAEKERQKVFEGMNKLRVKQAGEEAANAEKLEKARLKDMQEGFDKELGNLAKQRKLQQLVNEGLEREAEERKIIWELDEKRKQFINGSKEQRLFDANRSKVLEARLALWDDRQEQAIRRARERIDAADAQRFAPRLQTMTARSVRAESVEGMRLVNRMMTTPLGGVAEKQLSEAKKQTEVLNTIAVNTSRYNESFETMSFG